MQPKNFIITNPNYFKIYSLVTSYSRIERTSGILGIGIKQFQGLKTKEKKNLN